MHAFSPDNSWTLFLDRDGILNRRIESDFVKTPGEFVWNDGALDCLPLFAKIFGTIVVVTNQQGIGQGELSVEQLDAIHRKMLEEAHAAGGRIDKVYFCPDAEGSQNLHRKPGIGMALQARKEFPGINFRRSVMLGDTFTDMLFGKRLKMTTILVSEDRRAAREHAPLVDYWFPDMSALGGFMKNSQKHI
jgi:D-glycero-D-manno-heptose 1,7-bisphosphate phosphatase